MREVFEFDEESSYFMMEDMETHFIELIDNHNDSVAFVMKLFSCYVLFIYFLTIFVLICVRL